MLFETQCRLNKKLSYRRETARQLHTSFSAHSLIVHFTEHRMMYKWFILPETRVIDVYFCRW